MKKPVKKKVAKKLITEKLMTEQQFIEHFKKLGFGLFNINSVLTANVELDKKEKWADLRNKQVGQLIDSLHNISCKSL